MDGAGAHFKRQMTRNLHIRIFICKRGGKTFPHQDWLDIDSGVSLYVHGRTSSKEPGACGTLHIRELSDQYLNTPLSRSRPDRNCDGSTSGTTSYNFPIDGTALLATSSSLQNARNTHGVDLSEMASDATRIFCQVTWNCPHAKQDAFLEHAHAERAAAASGA
jgi:hypothetical protein